MHYLGQQTKSVDGQKDPRATRRLGGGVRRWQKLWRKKEHFIESGKLDRRKYAEAKRCARKALWRAKEVKREELTRDLISEQGKKNVFKVAKQMAKEQVDIEGICCMKDEDGNIMVSSADIKVIF